MLTKLVLGITLLPVLFQAGATNHNSSALRIEPGYLPILTASPSVAYPNQTIPVVVVLKAAPASDETVTISTSDPTQFSSIPSSVVVAAGTSSVTYYATFSSSAGGYVEFTSTAAHGSTYSTTYVDSSDISHKPVSHRK